MSVSIYYTTVINQSGGKKNFSFLPPHGLILDNLQSITYKGDITDRLIPSWPHHKDPNRPPNPRKVSALVESENNKELVIIRSNVNQKIKRLTSIGQLDPIIHQLIRKA